MKDCKYIRFEDGFITFPKIISHDEAARLMSPHLGAVESAGFVKDGVCCGESISLNVKSLPEDSELLRSAVGSGHKELRASLVSLKRWVVSSIEDEFYPDGDDDDGLQGLIENIKDRFDLAMKGE